MAKCKNCTRLFKEHDEEREKFGEVWCDKIFDSPDVEAERDCIHYKCMTNADRIRSMSDEELAKWLDKIVVNCHKDCCEGCPLEDSCWSDGISEFLKQPYKEKEE
jgi:hypothetical protein